MVRAVCSWLVAGVVVASMAGCSGGFWQSDDEYRDRAVSDRCDDPDCRECVASVKAEPRAAAPRTQVAEAPAPAAAGDPELAAMRAQIQKLQADIARVKSQAPSAPAPANDGASFASLARINGEMNELQAQKSSIERRMFELEEQRRMLASGVGRPNEPVQISKRADPSDAALQAEEARLRESLKQYDTPRR